MWKLTQVCCLLLLVSLIFLTGWWRHHGGHHDDDDDGNGCGHGGRHDDDDRHGGKHDDDDGHGGRHDDDDDHNTCGDDIDVLPCVSDPFGIAQPYSLFSLSSVLACNSGIEGPIASNGPVRLESFSVGLRVPETGKSTLVSSNTITWSHGTLWHGGMIGSAVTADFVTILNGGQTYASSDCCPTDACGLCGSGANETVPVDFITAGSYLSDLHQFYNELPSSKGSSSEVVNGTLTLTCPEGNNYTIFSGVNATGVSQITIDCANQTVLVNYDASQVLFDNVAMTLSVNTDRSKIIHHFNGDTLTLIGDDYGDVFGTVFAPKSKLSFSGSIIYGNVIAASYANLEGGCNNGKINYVPFTGCIPVTK